MKRLYIMKKLLFIAILGISAPTLGISRHTINILKETKECHHCDLTSISLASTDLPGAKLFKSVYSNTNLSNTNLEGANLQQSFFKDKVVLTKANLDNADLSEAVIYDDAIVVPGDKGNFPKFNNTKLHHAKIPKDFIMLHRAGIINPDFTGAQIRRDAVPLSFVTCENKMCSNINLKDLFAYTHEQGYISNKHLNDIIEYFRKMY